MNVLVVTPTYNERENLPLLAAGVLKHDGYRLLVVDDGSPDGTGAIARSARRRASRARRGPASHRARGLGRSYIDGLLHAIKEGRADFICQMDCDLSHDPEYLPSLVNAAAAGHDLVIGSRYMNGGVSVVNWPIRRILLSAFGNRYIRFVTESRRQRLHQRLPLLAPRGAGAAADRRMVSDGYSFLVEMLYEAKQRRLPDRRSPDHLRRAPPRPVEAVVQRADRVADHAVAPRLPRART